MIFSKQMVSKHMGWHTSVVLIALGSTGEQLGHGGAHSLGGAPQVLSTFLQLHNTKSHTQSHLAAYTAAGYAQNAQHDLHTQTCTYTYTHTDRLTETHRQIEADRHRKREANTKTDSYAHRQTDTHKHTPILQVGVWVVHQVQPFWHPGVHSSRSGQCWELNLSLEAHTLHEPKAGETFTMQLLPQSETQPVKIPYLKP